MILDTNILILLERETRKGIEGKGTRFLNGQGEGRFYLTPTILGELACGASLSDEDAWRQFVSPFEVLPHDPSVSWHYGQTYRDLAARGCLIGANDLWIAAAALAHDQALATANIGEFSRVTDLIVIPVE